MGRGAGSGRLRAALGLALSIFAGSNALAAASNKIGVASLISPTAANTFYGSATTSTNGTGASGRPAEIVELAAALNNDPDLIYEFVRNNIETTWTYGLSKGALGALVDRHGSSFDQAHLMVELLRQAGFTAGYQIGTISLTPQQFSDWSGITSAAAACQLLSSGGIPAVINGTTTADCSYGAATVSSIQLGHAVVTAVIGGTTYYFDPAFKAHTFAAGINLQSAMQLTSGDLLTTLSTSTYSQTGTSSGVPSQNVITPPDAKLSTYSTNLKAIVDAASPADAMIDLVGGQTIVEATIPTGGVRQTSLSYFTSLRTISGGIPDQYRAQLRVQLDKARPGGATTAIIDKTVYADEVYARRLMFAPNFDTTGSTFTAALKLVDDLGSGLTLASAPAGLNDDPTYSRGTITLTVGMPYAASATGGSAGSYMDTVIARPLSYALPFYVLNAWGDAGRGILDKWGATKDQPLPAAPADCDGCFPSYPRWTGESRRAQMTASWIAQASKAARVNAIIAKSIYTQHYSIGFVAADTTVLTGASTPAVYAVADSFDRIEAETGFSLTSKTAVALDRRAAIHTIAAVIDGLKGTAASQIADLPDVQSASTRFADGTTASSLKYYRYTTTTQAQQALGLTDVEGQQSTANTGTHNGGEPTIGSAEMTSRRNANSNAIAAYVQAGFAVTARSDALAGPGARGGAYRKVGAGSYTHDPSRQRGGALAATLYDANGDPLEIAHALVGPDGSSTGGGVGAQVYTRSQYDPADSADVIKGRFVKRGSGAGIGLATGSLTEYSPATITNGPGDGMPTKVQANLLFRNGDVSDTTYGPVSHTGPQAGWIANWTNSLTVSGSTLEALGETDGRAALNSIVAFASMQDIYRSAPSIQRDVWAEWVLAWWQQQLQHNVASVAVGDDTIQVLKEPVSSSWGFPSGAKIVLATPEDVIKAHPSCYSGPISYVPTTGWSPVNWYDVTSRNGTRERFSVWQNDVRDSPSGTACSRQRGRRLTGWDNNYTINANPLQVSFGYASSSPGYAVEQLSSISSSVSSATISLTQGGLSGFTNGLGGANLRSVTVSTSGARVNHTDPTAAVTGFEVSTIGSGIQQRYRLDKVFAADNASSAATQYGYDSLGRVSTVKDAFGVLGTRSPEVYKLAFGTRATYVDRLGYSTTTYFNDKGATTRAIDALNNVTTFAYNTRGALKSATSPEGLVAQSSYDKNGNVIESKKLAKAGSAEAGQTITTSAAYDQTYNTPLWTKDARNTQTSYTYGGYYLQSVAGPEGTSSVAYNTWGGTNQVQDWWGRYTTAVFSSGALYTTTINGGVSYYSKSAQGDLNSVTGPLGGGYWGRSYDANRRLVLKWDPAVTPPVAVGTTYAFDPVGRLTQVSQGSFLTVSPWTFTPIQTNTYAYDAVGNKIKETTPAAVTQYSYDAMNRLVCTALRMNPSVYGSLPTDACVQSTAGTYGPDRISRNTYDAAGRLIQTEIGVGTSLVQPQVRYTYSADGLKLTLTDANNNTSAYAYDGFNRLKRLYFPSTTRGAGVASTTDYEEYGYDANGNRTSLRKRDGNVVQYTYNTKNELTKKDFPGTTTKDILFDYDTGGRRNSSSYSDGTSSISWGYNDTTLMSGEGGQTWGGTSSYDSAGNRIKYDLGGCNPAAVYDYDAAYRLTAVKGSSASSCSGGQTATLATVAYGPLNRRASITRYNGIVTEYGYDGAGRLSSLVHKWSSGPIISSQTYAYSPASEIVSQTQTSPTYVWTGQPTSTVNVTHDGLNRDAAMAAASGYDANGNLISDGVRTFAYDIENRLTSVGGQFAATNFTYDSIGRWLLTGGATSKAWYDGDRLVLDANGSGTRFIHADGIDEPIVSLPLTASAGWVNQVTYLLADRQGSIVATSTASGAITPYTYGPYGEPQSWAGSRFRYTGQLAVPEAQLYYYKARMYDPVLGRFLQTDPVGYGDGPNMYAYVGGRPTNATDPSGRNIVGEIFVTPRPFVSMSFYNIDFQSFGVGNLVQNVATDISQAWGQYNECVVTKGVEACSDEYKDALCNWGNTCDDDGNVQGEEVVVVASNEKGVQNIDPADLLTNTGRLMDCVVALFSKSRIEALQCGLGGVESVQDMLQRQEEQRKQEEQQRLYQDYLDEMAKKKDQADRDLYWCTMVNPNSCSSVPIVPW